MGLRHLIWGQDNAGSSPVTQTILTKRDSRESELEDSERCYKQGYEQLTLCLEKKHNHNPSSSKGKTPLFESGNGIS